jgi:Domain of unknown function (DUF4136)
MGRLAAFALSSFVSVSFVSVSLATAGCTSSVDVHAIRAPNAHFERYRTFAFELSQHPPRKFEASAWSADVRDKVEQTTARVLEERGYMHGAPGNPADMLVRIEAGRRERTELMSTGSPAIGTGVAGQPIPSSGGDSPSGESPGAAPGPALAEMGYHGELDQEEQDLVEGAFVIDAFDAESHRILWHGSARAQVSPGPLNEDRLRRAVESVLASFPARE